MSTGKLIRVLIVCLIGAPIVLFGYRYLFDPNGINVAAAEICVSNKSGQTLLFVVEAKNGARMLEILETGNKLCSPTPQVGDKGVVGVFVDEDALEGCSRLTRAGKTEILIGYAKFDNCEWQLDN